MLFSINLLFYIHGYGDISITNKLVFFHLFHPVGTMSVLSKLQKSIMFEDTLSSQGTGRVKGSPDLVGHILGGPQVSMLNGTNEQMEQLHN